MQAGSLAIDDQSPTTRTAIRTHLLSTNSFACASKASHGAKGTFARPRDVWVRLEPAAAWTVMFFGRVLRTTSLSTQFIRSLVISMSVMIAMIDPAHRGQ